jgi:regulator of sigma E protease
MEALLKFSQTALLILVVIGVFNLIIFVHELGHYWAAKWRGLKIDRFQIWFGKPIWSKTINGVQYGLGWIPAGGFVALPQMAPMEAIEGSNLEHEHLPPIKPLDKIIVAFAGPLFSFLLALTAAFGVWTLGKPAEVMPTRTIGWVEPGSPGDKAGLKRGDVVEAVNGIPVDSWDGTLDSIQLNIMTSRGSHIEFKVDRPGAGKLTLHSEFEIPKTEWYQRRAPRRVGIEPIATMPVTIGEIAGKNAPAEKAGLKKDDVILAINGEEIVSDSQTHYLIQKSGGNPLDIRYKRGEETGTATVTPQIPITPVSDPPRFQVGIGISQDPRPDIRQEIVKPSPLQQMRETVRMMALTIVAVISPDSSIGIQHLSGPIGIGKVQYNFLLMDHPILRIIAFLVLININLAILNMMPFPVLDGGHIVLAIMEWIAKRPVRVRLLEYIQLCFVFLLFGVMLYVSSKDLFDDFGRGGGKKRPETVFPG